MTGACVRDCTVLAAAGLLASTRKSYNRAKSESAGPLQFHQRGTGNGLSVLRLSAQACTA